MKRLIVSNLLRIMGLSIIAIITLFVLNIMFSFNGNPYKLENSGEILKKFIFNQYGRDNYILDNVKYSFKDDLYYIHLQSKEYFDDNFNIYYDYDNKKVIDNEYIDKVINRNNTITRLQNDMVERITEIFDNNYPNDIRKNITKIDVNFIRNEINSISTIKLDATLNDARGYPVSITVNINNDNNNEFKIARDIRILKRILIENSIYIDKFTVIYNKLLDASVFQDITSNKISESNFLSYIEELNINREKGEKYE